MYVSPFKTLSRKEIYSKHNSLVQHKENCADKPNCLKCLGEDKSFGTTIPNSSNNLRDPTKALRVHPHGGLRV